MLVIEIIAFIVLLSVRVVSSDKNIVREERACQLENEEYIYGIEYYEDNNRIISAGGDSYISDAVAAEKYDDAKKLITTIKEYFGNNNGSCE